MAYAWRSLEQPAYRRLNFVAGMRRVTWACAARYIARKPSYIREKEGGVVLCDTPRAFTFGAAAGLLVAPHSAARGLGAPTGAALRRIGTWRCTVGTSVEMVIHIHTANLPHRIPLTFLGSVSVPCTRHKSNILPQHDPLALSLTSSWL